MAAYNDALPANGLSKGFSSCAPWFEMARRVDQASKDAAPLEATANSLHMNCLRRFSARNSPTETFQGFPGLKNAIGAGVVPATGMGASGSAALNSIAG